MSHVLPMTSYHNMVLPVLSFVGRRASFKISSIVSISTRSVPEKVSVLLDEDDGINILTHQHCP